ncbi:hypothetical protein [Desulfoluna spongiiphila]|uniref:Nicotinamide mononucleotide transporter n=1 Tax=Desulfoluna spongiiphila TaxID=419481 RepID=A0A1G5ENF8_9BACT|nr:hypothetical protein [Desulfoluna spongiiphila]SCY28464.1 hypothetical protein SAMN05216233_106119 [Desulfoluna spongiiphila]
MDMVLQLWGGSFYLINKMCFSLAEGRGESRKRQLKLWGWGIYILGVPAWVTILILKHNWIAASIEAGGIPSMALGLFSVYRNNGKNHGALDGVATVCTYGFMVLGAGFSLYDYHGLNSVSQVLEIGVMVGFLMGSYYLAKERHIGWLFFMLMNGSMGTLMLLQEKPILAFQQGVSLCFVMYGFMRAIGTSLDGEKEIMIR